MRYLAYHILHTSRSITFELFKACIGIISAEQSEVEEYIVDVEEVCQINSTVVNCTEEGAQFDYWVSTNKASWFLLYNLYKN